MRGNNIFFKVTLIAFTAFLFLTKPGEVFSRELKDVFFASGDFTLDNEAIKNIENNIRLLKENLDSKLLLEGYCDEKGDPELNRELSAKRVRAVKQYLVSHGIQIARISTKEMGSTDKFSNNDSSGSYEVNRRVHFVLLEPDLKNPEDTVVKNGSEYNDNINVQAKRVEKEIVDENQDASELKFKDIVDFRMRKSLAAPLNFVVPGNILNQKYFTVYLEVPDNYSELLLTKLDSGLRDNGLSDISEAFAEDTQFALKGQNFEIERSGVSRSVSDNKSNYKTLSWKVKPTKEGIQSLILSIKLGKRSGNNKDLLEIPLYEKVVKVEPGYISSVSVVVSNYRVVLIILSIMLILFIMYRNIPGMFPR